MKFSYDNRTFRSISNSDNGEVSGDTVFHYHQDEYIVWAEYSGGEIVRGMLIALTREDGSLNMRYQHVNRTGELRTGVCISTPELISDGRLRLRESWIWTCGDNSTGESLVEELYHEELDSESEGWV